MDRATLQKLASDAGFGANLRNTHAVKLELFAAAVEREHSKEAARLILDMADALRNRSDTVLTDLVAEAIDHIAVRLLAIANGGRA